jgi:hypothetical protein
MRSLIVTSVAVALVLGSFAGCSSSPDQVQDAGLGFTVQEQVFVPFPNGAVWVYLSDRTGLCDVLQVAALPKSSHILALQMGNKTTGTHYLPTIPGTYPLVPFAGPGLYGDSQIYLFDNLCSLAFNGASSGELVLSAIDQDAGSFAVGTYDLTFGLARIQGSFDAGFCAPPASDAGLPDGGSDCL